MWQGILCFCKENHCILWSKAKLVYNRNVPKVVEYTIKSVVSDQKEMTKKLKTVEVSDDRGKPIGSIWKNNINWSIKFWYIPDKRTKGLNLYWFARKLWKSLWSLINIQNTLRWWMVKIASALSSEREDENMILG